MPRIKTIDCPNKDCPTNSKSSKGEEGEGEEGESQEPEKEIIYLRYDNNNMKFIYLCTTCNNVWTN